MRLLYLCKADPPPPHSDYVHVLEFHKKLPKHLQPLSSLHGLYFADRVDNKLMTEFYDFLVVFVSGRFLTDATAMECLKNTSKKFSNMICIDLFDNLTESQKDILRDYTPNIYSTEEGKRYLANSFPEKNVLSEQEAEELKKSIETDGYKYLEDTITSLTDSSKNNKLMGGLCYVGALSVLIGALSFVIFKTSWAPVGDSSDLYTLIYECIRVVVLSGLAISITRFLFLLGKSFMVEAIRFSDRAHAIGLGKLYLQLYKSKFEWTELKDVLQNWNIDRGSAFINLDAKDIENAGIEKIISSINKK